VQLRPELDLADPVVWAKQNLPALLKDAELPILLSHAGLKADRAILPLAPDSTLFAGAHDHLRFIHREGRTVYFHSGSWTDGFSLASLHSDAAGNHRWTVEQFPITATDPADPELAALIQKISAQHLMPEDLAVLGRNPTSAALAPAEAARFVVAALRTAAGADAAVIGATTFGAGLPAGEITRFALDACVRFDGTIFIGEITGAELAAILEKSNQDPATPFAARRGENLIAVGPTVPLDPTRRYRLATTDWAAKNARTYFGSETLGFVEQPTLHLKAIATTALSPAP
jgi:2',3'-cyclic-nucleotide 2'-phosphodiesterase (5'-nucleotidase family)